MLRGSSFRACVILVIRRHILGRLDDRILTINVLLLVILSWRWAVMRSHTLIVLLRIWLSRKVMRRELVLLVNWLLLRYGLDLRI